MARGFFAPFPVGPQALNEAASTLGHLDPAFLDIMNGISAMLREVFQTQNPVTGVVSGTGTAGMEAAL